MRNRCQRAPLATDSFNYHNLQRLRPVAAVECTVLYGLRQVFHRQILLSFDVRDGPGDLQDAIMGSRGETLLLHGSFQQAFGIGRQTAISSDLASAHLGIAVDALLGVGKAGGLAFTSQ